MNPRPKIYFYQGKPPAYFIPLILLLGIVVLAILVLFGFFLGIAVGVALIIFGVMRLFSSKSRKKFRTIDEDGRTTIILDREDYEVIEKGKKN
jgi:MFS superfamily sulfate permease-like transporter